MVDGERKMGDGQPHLFLPHPLPRAIGLLPVNPVHKVDIATLILGDPQNQKGVPVL